MPAIYLDDLSQRSANLFIYLADGEGAGGIGGTLERESSKISALLCLSTRQQLPHVLDHSKQLRIPQFLYENTPMISYPFTNPPFDWPPN